MRYKQWVRASQTERGTDTCRWSKKRVFSFSTKLRGARNWIKAYTTVFYHYKVPEDERRAEIFNLTCVREMRRGVMPARRRAFGGEKCDQCYFSVSLPGDVGGFLLPYWCVLEGSGQGEAWYSSLLSLITTSSLSSLNIFCYSKSLLSTVVLYRLTVTHTLLWIQSNVLSNYFCLPVLRYTGLL